MGKTRVSGIGKAYQKRLASTLLKPIVEEQTELLVEYAKSEIQDIGNVIQTYNSRNNMDRTGNLLDSLCWGVSYNGKMAESGFYRSQKATELSYLHEWFHDNTEPVGGHVLASNFIKRMKNLRHNGWRVFFAILAPYWGYWEKGFNFKGWHGTRFLQFSVMTSFYDSISEDLKPMKVTLKSEYPPTYTKESWSKLRDRRDTELAKGGKSVFDKYAGKYSGVKSRDERLKERRERRERRKK